MPVRLIGVALGGVVSLGLLVWGVLAVSLRTKFRPVLDRVRRLNRALWNPLVMKEAGSAGADTSVIGHVGRTTGTAYETPVGAVETEEGFVIGLPYGTTPDWIKNVLAAGSASLRHGGETCHVVDPELVRAAGADRHFGAGQRRIHRLYGIDDFLLLRRAESLVGETGR